ncbi:MAG TPA: L,D-transpeptidase [Solirubrobacteraceae bacterium]|nr:L,D-transpeptidase [Solirubrobacteraceae bacterium]
MATFIASLAAVALVCGPATATAQSVVAGATVLDPMSSLEQPGSAVVLSDEKRVTRWAHANETYPIRIAASPKARTITRLRFETEDKYPEVYLVLDGKLDQKGEPWLHIRVPMRPNGRTGWVPAEMLSQLYVVRTQLVIDRTAKRAKLYKNGRRIWEARVGIGKAGTPTPRGAFWVRERLKGFGGSYGPWAFGTSAYSNISDWPNGGVVGIHGTNEPGLIPGSPSHGCVRVRNDGILRLARLMPIGTPVRIVR